MKKFAFALLSCALVLAACTPADTSTPVPPVGTAAPTPELSLTTAPVDDIPPAIYRTEPFATGIGFPTAMEFAPDGRLFVAEKNGTVRYITPDGKVSDPVLTLVNIDPSGERGLLGLALDPKFADNGYFWVFYTRKDKTINRVSRFTLKGNVAGDEQVSFEFNIAFQTSTILNGGSIKFGPDGMLYIAAGSTNNVIVSNDPKSPNGKIHRVDPTTFPAQPAPGNPDPTSTIFATGLRNVYKFTFNPTNGWLYASENGGDCDDEIDLIVAGGDYGWHKDGLCEDNNLPDDYPYKKPLLYFTPTIAPTGITFYNGSVFPEWKGNLFYCSWHWGKLVRLDMADDGTHLIKAERIETGDDKPCRLDLTQGPEGDLYFGDITTIYRVVRN